MTKLHTFIGAALLSITFNAQAGDCPALSGQYSIGKDDADFALANGCVFGQKYRLQAMQARHVIDVQGHGKMTGGGSLGGAASAGRR